MQPEDIGLPVSQPHPEDATKEQMNEQSFLQPLSSAMDDSLFAPRQDSVRLMNDSKRDYSLVMDKEDSVLFNNILMGSEQDSEFQKISVSNPVKIKDVAYYTVVAFDAQGEYTAQRRYSDFEALREAWKKRLPGLFFPFLPPKKYIGNTDQSHLEERSFLLEQFLRKIYKLPYLIQSEEFSIFSRHQVQTDYPVKKALEALPPQSVNVLSFRVKSVNRGNIHASPSKTQKQWQEIEATKQFCKQHLERMLEIRDLMKKYVASRDEYMVENTNYVMEQLAQYETTNL